MRPHTDPTLEARRRAYVERIDPEDLAGVPAGQTVTTAVRLRCRDCRAETYLPARARDPRGSEVGYQLHARRCRAHRRSYETPAATPRVRDAQRGAVYRWERWLPAESTVDERALEDALGDGSFSFDCLIRAAPDGRYASLGRSYPPISFDECRRFADSVWTVLMPRDPEPSPQVVLAGRRRVSSVANADEIRLAPTMLHRMTVLHELAHTCLARVLPHGTYASHGPEFASLYLSLLSQWLGVSERLGRALGEGMRPRRVRFATPEHRAALTSAYAEVAVAAGGQLSMFTGVP